ncbi:hypothetical protein HBI81_125190 [Parastagonospora nodorum]|nr:hypothetical protein HBI10_204220 [Parastagonospora nodorum]KAH4011083.1 hypothetical protein HBI13_199970 [Parastagonospora nodorum]KAH4905974.1 hypothetical protein HBH74_176640 [Parastagonospora nodorum]KAH4928018.1 hypothetical protein HBI79_132740 [Parastagonospora nodorum]KAH4929255.1 hypothetical protein HBH73_194820 [Parastagonospora nodorum]
MPGLTIRKGPAVSLVQDQDIILAEPEAADFAITVIGALEEDGSKHVTDIHISSTIVKKSLFIQAFIEKTKDKSEITLGDGKFTEDGYNKEGTLVWLAHLQGLSQQRMKELGLWEISLLGVWYAILYWDSHQDKKARENLGEWFDNWYRTSMSNVQLTIPIARALVYPYYLFDNAKGYAQVTKYLAYNHVGHVKERPPKGFKGGKHLHVGERQFVGPVNHARGGLRNTLHKSLYSRVGRILRSKTTFCDCWDATIGRYQLALTKCEAWPVDDVLTSSSIAEVTRRLKAFKLNYTAKCKRCASIDWESVVLRACSNTDGYFNGICLDCQDRSKPKGEGLDDEYEKHNQPDAGRWDTRCRFKHGQPTWYISWLGRPDIREKMLRGPDNYRAPEEE